MTDLLPLLVLSVRGRFAALRFFSAVACCTRCLDIIVNTDVEKNEENTDVQG